MEMKRSAMSIEVTAVQSTPGSDTGSDNKAMREVWKWKVRVTSSACKHLDRRRVSLLDRRITQFIHPLVLFKF